MNLLLAIAGVCALCASRAAGAGPILNLGYAQYQGVTNSSIRINKFYGIRYAQAPVGQLRWQAPLDIELNNNYSSQGVMNATVPGPTCIQGIPYWSNSTPPMPPTGAEDCLLVDVYTPTNPVNASLPIMIQVHGGGYTEGSSLSEPGDAIMAQANGSLVYVAIQYRLGAFGYLSSAEIKENGSPNTGALDQRASFLWTQRNAKSFGGDPAKITIVGGSAGGGSVMDQMILYGGDRNPPFRAVISQRSWWNPLHNDSVLEDQYRRLLNTTACGNLECLRQVPQETLASASQETYAQAYLAGVYGFGDFYFGPSVDGEIIRALPQEEFKRGHFTKVPLIVDRDGYEGVLFSNKSQTTFEEEEADLQQLFPYAKSSFWARLWQLYPSSAFNSTFFQRQTLFGDFIICCPTYYMASALTDSGQPVYKLIFDAGSQLHGATTPYLWSATLPGDNFGTQGANITLGNIMKDWWLSFTVHLDPNAQSWSNATKPYWPTYMSAGSNFSVMDVNYTMMGVTMDFDASPQCDFFHGQGYVVRN